jgi:hypothetical protein
MRDGFPQMVVRYSGWRDRLAARFPGRRRRTLQVTQAVVNDMTPELEERVREQARDLMLYGATYVDASGKRIPPEEVRVPRA